MENTVVDISEIGRLMSGYNGSLNLSELHNFKELVEHMSIDEQCEYVSRDIENIMLFGGKNAHPKVLKAAIIADEELWFYMKVDPDMTDRKLIYQYMTKSYSDISLYLIKKKRYDIIMGFPRKYMLYFLSSPLVIKRLYDKNRSLLLQIKQKYIDDTEISGMLFNNALHMATSRIYHMTAILRFLYPTVDDIVSVLSIERSPDNATFYRRMLYMSRYNKRIYLKIYYTLDKRHRMGLERLIISEGEFSTSNLSEKELLNTFYKFVTAKSRAISMAIRYTNFFTYRVRDPDNIIRFCELLHIASGSISYPMAFLMNNRDLIPKMKPENILKLKLNYGI